MASCKGSSEDRGKESDNSSLDKVQGSIDEGKVVGSM